MGTDGDAALFLWESVALKATEKAINTLPVTCRRLNPFTPTSDQDRISPYNINTISSREVTRIEKNVNHGIIS